MNSSLPARLLCIMLAVLLGVPSGFAQASASGPQNAATKTAGAPLTVAVLEGNNIVNSLSLLRAVAPVVEIRDQNDFPVEGATVVFQLPEQGTGGTFTGGATSFTTRSDSHGQATSPLIIPKLAGKFSIRITATAGDRKGETLVTQTNATGAYVGPTIPPHPWYMKKRNWAIAGGAIVATVLVVALTRKSGSSSQIIISPGTPVFH
jgi:hypothetical protein